MKASQRSHVSPSNSLHTRSSARHDIPWSSSNPSNRAMEWTGIFFLNICFIFNYVYVCVDICTQRLELGDALKTELQ